MVTVVKKVILLGDGAVGKTSLVNQFVSKRFSDEYIQTIGTNCSKKELSYPDKGFNIKLMVYDLIGQKGYEVTQKKNMSGSNAAIMVCDITRPETADSLESYWLPLVHEVSEKTPPLTFLINKSDLLDAQNDTARRTCSEILKLSNNHQSKFYITSAKSGANVEQAFRDTGLISMAYEPTKNFDIEIYRTDGNISNIKALDMIQSQVYQELGGPDFAGPVLKKMIHDLGIDVSEGPTKKQLEDLVQKIKKIEASFLNEKDIKEYYTRRKGLLAKVIA